MNRILQYSDSDDSEEKEAVLKKRGAPIKQQPTERLAATRALARVNDKRRRSEEKALVEARRAIFV